MHYNNHPSAAARRAWPSLALPAQWLPLLPLLARRAFPRALAALCAAAGRAMLPPAAAASAPRLLGHFVGSTPVTLFRIQVGASVRLQLLSASRAAGRASYEIADDASGFVQPRAASEARFLGPNGMSMRPLGGMLAVIVANFRGARARSDEVPAGTPPRHCRRSSRYCTSTATTTPCSRPRP